MDSQKINHLQIEKPKILNTLSSLNRNESNHILNEYRTRGSESLMPIKQMHFERSRKKLLPTLNETSEGKNKLLDNFTDKLQKNDKIHSKKKINFTIPAHSKSPVKLNRQILKPLDPIEESGNQNQKIDFVLRGVKSRFMKPNVELRMSALKEKNKDNIAELQFYKYCIGNGNNGPLVKKIMDQRCDFWQEVPLNTNIFNFKWHQNNRSYQYEKLNLNSNFKQLVNHFEYHKEISSKTGLIKNLAYYCEQNKMNLFDLTPITFIIDLNKDDSESTLQNFINFYHKNMPAEIQKPENLRKLYLDIPKKNKHYYNHNNYDKKTNIFGVYGKPKMLRSFVNGNSYLWLLKPNSFNRGWGIQIFKTLEELEKMIADLCEGVDEKTFAHMEKDENDKNKKNTIKLNTFVIQKYIERPLLIENRKFDIRVWALVTQNYELYFFREGYLRTSSEGFLLDANMKNNHFIHLTNNAIQKNGKNYGQFEDGNQLSFQNFENYLTEHKINLDFKKQVLPKIKEDILISMNSVKRRLNQDDRKNCFEIFGYDFIIDEDFHVWLIEVNTNPCIEESSRLLHMLIPRMLNDAFKLTIDSIFPMSPNNKPKTQELSNTILIPSNNKIILSESKEIQNKQIIQNMEEVDKKQEIPSTDLLNINTNNNNIENNNSNIEKANKNVFKENNENILQNRIAENLDLESVQTKKEAKITETFSCDGYDDNENLWDLLGNIKMIKIGSRTNDKKS